MTTNTEASESIAKRYDESALAATVPYVLGDEYFDPSGLDKTWIRIVARMATSRQTLGNAGSRRFTRRGLLFIQVFSPSESGTFEGEDIARQLLGLYESVTFDGVCCMTGVIFGVPNGNDAKWNQIQLNIDFIYHETK